MRNIRCAFVASYFGPYYSNFVASMLSFESEMKNKGYFTVYILPIEAKKFCWISRMEEAGAKIYYIKYAPRSIGNVLSLKHIFKIEKINLIYSHMCGWDFTARLATPLTPIIWHMHMRVLLTGVSHRVKNWIKFHILAFGRVYHIAASTDVMDAINSLHPHNKCIAAINAIVFERLGDLENHYKIHKPYRLLIFGWSPIVKGLDITLDACERINKDGIFVELYVSAQKNTFAYVSDRYVKIPKWIHLLNPTDHVEELYNYVDCMISASRSEGFSYCLAETIYAGLPIIYSNISGTSWAKEFESTYVFESENSMDLEKVINNVMASTVITEDMVEHNRKIMENKYSLSSWTNTIVKFMENI